VEVREFAAPNMRGLWRWGKQKIQEANSLESIGSKVLLSERQFCQSNSQLALGIHSGSIADWSERTPMLQVINQLRERRYVADLLR
jgi:hypothetical protein